LTVKVNCAPPAVALLGEIELTTCVGVEMTKVTAFDTGPSESALLQLQTLTRTLPALAIALAGIVAVSWSPLGETEMTLQQLPNCSTEPLDKKPPGSDEKPLPLTVRVKLAPPAATVFGEIEAIVGVADGDGGDGDGGVGVTPPPLPQLHNPISRAIKGMAAIVLFIGIF
jgi:hypothetical protein